MNQGGSPVVFVGNIPYDGSEQELKELFSEVGSVVSFRLVSDRETGKPKGFGFCEYNDAETARSAIRNLHEVLFHGRKLRVNSADDDKATVGGKAPANLALPRKRLGVDAISQVIDELSSEEQLEVLAQMKSFIEIDPEGARQLLGHHQQLAQAMLRLLVLYDAVTSADIQGLTLPTNLATVPSSLSGLPLRSSTVPPGPGPPPPPGPGPGPVRGPRPVPNSVSGLGPGPGQRSNLGPGLGQGSNLGPGPGPGSSRGPAQNLAQVRGPPIQNRGLIPMQSSPAGAGPPRIRNGVDMRSRVPIGHRYNEIPPANGRRGVPIPVSRRSGPPPRGAPGPISHYPSSSQRGPPGNNSIPPGPELPAEAQEMLTRVMKMSEEEIAHMAPDVRRQVLELRQKFANRRAAASFGGDNRGPPPPQRRQPQRQESRRGPVPRRGRPRQQPY